MDKDALLQMALQTLEILVKDSGGTVSIDKRNYEDLLGRPSRLTIDAESPDAVIIGIKDEPKVDVVINGNN